MMGLRQIAIMIVLALWAAFATYQWVATGAKTDMLIQTALQDANLKAQAAASEQAEKARAESEAKTQETKIVYKTIKDTVYKNRVVNVCVGSFNNELRLALADATAAANGTVLPAQH